MARYKDKPFALVGVNSDGDRDVLVKLMKENGITWRNAVDGSRDGPLHTRWNIHGWPTFYLIDAKGVIRYRDVDEVQELQDAVDALLREANTGQ